METVTPTLGLPAVQTSLVEVTNTIPNAPCRIFFKNEFEQPSGSFKLRGIGNLVFQSLLEAREKYPNKSVQVFASSGGNAGLAAAYAAKYYKIPCTVVVPETTRSEIVGLLESYNAVVIMHGRNIYEADMHVKLIVSAVSRNIHPIYCHPFDNPLIWQGHSLLIDEVVQTQLSHQDRKKYKGTVASVGGGGLYCGLAMGIEKNNVDNKVLLVETKQAPTFSESIKAGSTVRLKSVQSLATSLACSYVSEQCLDYYHSQPTAVEVIDDYEAVRGSINYFDYFGLAVEPACGAAVSVVFNQLNLLKKHFGHLSKDDIVVVVVCGGSCTNREGIDEFRALVRRQAARL